MDTPDVTPNLLNDVLAPERPRLDVTPEKDPATGDLDAGSTEVLRLAESMEAPALSAVRRRALAGQTRVYQAAATAIGVSILTRSARVAAEAKTQPASVDNLLLLETALGSLRQAAWPVTAFALVTLRNTTLSMEDVLAEIDRISETPEGHPIKIALGQAQHVQQRGERSQKAGQKQRQKRKAAGAMQVGQKKQSIAGQKGAQRLARDLSQGTANPPLPAATGKRKASSKTSSKTSGKTGGKTSGKTPS